MIEQKLWHDSLDDALRDVVYGIGPKECAAALWPDLDPTSGARKLHHCLDPERAEKLSLSEIQFLIRLGAENGFHMPMAHLSSVCGYAPPEKVDPEDEKARLQRQFIEAKGELQKLVAQIARLG
jgi:hypothetical protein